MLNYGKKKQYTWPKIHIAMDHNTNEIIAVILMDSNAQDSMKTNSLLNMIDRVDSVTGDKG